MVVNKQIECTSKKSCHSSLYLINHCLMYRFQELITKELDNFTKIFIFFAKKPTILDNPRTITQESRKETRQMRPFFSFTPRAQTSRDIHPCIQKLSNPILMASPFCLLLIMNYKPLNFGVEGSWNENIWKALK